MGNYRKSFKYYLCIFSGEDVDIIFENKNYSIINFFSLIGLLVIFIFLICFTSSFVLLSKLFESNYLFDLLIGLFFALVISTIYIFLLYTITPSLLASRYKIGRRVFLNKRLSEKEKQQLNFFSGGIISSIFKYGYLFIISMIVSQPIIQYNHSLLFFQAKKLTLINSILACWEFDYLTSLLQSICVFIIFLLPVIFKYIIRYNGIFYFQKERFERKIVLNNYEWYYLTNWKSLLEKNDVYWNNRIRNKLATHISKIEKFDELAAFNLKNELFLVTKNTVFMKYERWSDPPFNTIEKEQEINIQNESEFINSVYQS
jgi:hypothetical protein